MTLRSMLSNRHAFNYVLNCFKVRKLEKIIHLNKNIWTKSQSTKELPSGFLLSQKLKV